jgi:hypothetical protein
MFTIIFSWIALFLVISFIGSLFLNKKVIEFLNLKGDIQWYEYFWVGLVAVLAILQIWSIFLPVNVYPLGFVFLLAFVAFAISIKNIRNYLRRISFKKLLWQNRLFIVIVGISLILISYASSLPVGWEDTLLYHLNIVKWNNLFPVTPGLANLHLRLGVSSSLFLFASMIDNLFLKDRSSHITLSLLASVISVEFIWLLLKSKIGLIKIFCLTIIPLLSSLILRRTLVASLSPDFALEIIVLAICIEFFQGDVKSLVIAGILSILLLTVKLSGVSFAAMILLFVLVKLGLYLKNKSIKAISFVVLSGLMLIIPYLYRDIILSGWLFYPLPLFKINVPWALPNNMVKAMYSVIKAWAIAPGKGWDKYVGMPFWGWFPGWYTRNNWAIEMKMFFSGAFLIIIAPLAKIINKKLIKKYANYFLVGVASFVSIFYMLFTAPDFRFGEIYFWIFFAVTAGYYVYVIYKDNPKLKMGLILVAAYLCFTITWPVRIDSKPIGKSVRWEPTFPVENYVIRPDDGSPPFNVFRPTDSELCGNSELPCAPQPEKLKIKEIVPGDFSKGFMPVD